MGILISDTARNNLASWTIRAIEGGYASGAYLSPFTSPLGSNSYKKSAKDTASRIQDAGGEFWFDPMSYALDMPRAGDFRHYETWNLWSQTRGDLSDQVSRIDHIKRVYEIQTVLGSPLLAPSLLLTNPNSQKSQQALDFSIEANETDNGAWLTISGSQEFWSSEDELDAHIGALNQLEPAGWLLVVTRSETMMPPTCSEKEICGLMRTVYALSQDREVRIAFGDLAALPAVAAGATSICTGWDLRQRICAYQDFEERANDTSGGGWYQRPTLLGLMGGLTAREYSILVSEDQQLADSLTPGTIGPRPELAFKHHAQVLNSIITELNSLTDAPRVNALRGHYDDALTKWDDVIRITGTTLGPRQWIMPFKNGLDVFMNSEGWI